MGLICLICLICPIGPIVPGRAPTSPRCLKRRKLGWTSRHFLEIRSTYLHDPLGRSGADKTKSFVERVGDRLQVTDYRLRVADWARAPLSTASSALFNTRKAPGLRVGSDNPPIFVRSNRFTL
jgi:hypothetical protein